MTVTNTTPSVREAVYSFLETYLAPPVAPDHIIWGNQNNLTLPEDGDDFVIFYLMSNVRHGSGFEHWDKVGADEQTVSETLEGLVQIDCYCSGDNPSDAENARLRAQTIETLARSTVAPSFFRKKGMGCLYSEDAKDTTTVGEGDLYQHRWTVTLHISYPSRVVISQDFFIAVDVNLHPVDVEYKP